MDEEARITVRVSALLRELIPAFLAHRHDDIERLGAARARGDFEAARRVGHGLRGTAGSWGFADLSALGGDIEAAARAMDGGRLEELMRGYESYLARLDVRFEEP